MPRRRPKGLRAERWRPRRGVPVRRIRGISAATRVAIRKLEEDRLWPGAVAAALAECRWYLGQPGRVLPDLVIGCDCCDPLVARDRLEDVLLWLPRGARADLGRLVARLDAEFDRRAVSLSTHLMLATRSVLAGIGAGDSWRTEGRAVSRRSAGGLLLSAGCSHPGSRCGWPAAAGRKFSSCTSTTSARPSGARTSGPAHGGPATTPAWPPGRR